MSSASTIKNHSTMSFNAIRGDFKPLDNIVQLFTILKRIEVTLTLQLKITLNLKKEK